MVPPNAEGFVEAARAVRAGEVVAYPTETVYGLGVDPFSDEAVRRLFAVKGRDPSKPVLVIVADVEQLKRVTEYVSDLAWVYVRAFWPGPLSLLLPKAGALAEALTAGQEKVCVRCPGSALARRLCRAVGFAITSSSANLSGEPPARSLDALDLPGVSIGIDGGLLADSAPSTVFDPDTGHILREGAISEARVKAAWQRT